MRRKSALAVLVAACAVLPATASAMSETDCAAQWKSADGNGDGVLVGPEADRYLAYYRVRAHVTPVDGRITQQEFMKACQSDIFMAKVPEPGAPLKGANSFTEGQAKDRAIAHGEVDSVAGLKKDDDGIWRGTGTQAGKTVQIAVDYKGNVVTTAQQ